MSSTKVQSLFSQNHMPTKRGISQDYYIPAESGLGEDIRWIYSPLSVLADIALSTEQPTEKPKKRKKVKAHGNKKRKTKATTLKKRSQCMAQMTKEERKKEWVRRIRKLRKICKLRSSSRPKRDGKDVTKRKLNSPKKSII